MTLKKVADAMYITVGDLIGENEDLDYHPKQQLETTNKKQKR